MHNSAKCIRHSNKVVLVVVVVVIIIIIIIVQSYEIIKETATFSL